MYMPNSPNFRASQASEVVFSAGPGQLPPDRELGARLAEQIVGLEDAIHACFENAAKLREVLDPVLLPESPVVGGPTASPLLPPVCPYGEKLRELASRVQDASAILQTIQRRLAVG